jgi:hypothetical protein
VRCGVILDHEAYRDTLQSYKPAVRVANAHPSNQNTTNTFCSQNEVATTTHHGAIYVHPKTRPVFPYHSSAQLRQGFRAVAHPGIFRGVGATNSVKDRGVPLNLQMSEIRILIWLLRKYLVVTEVFGCYGSIWLLRNYLVVTEVFGCYGSIWLLRKYFPLNWEFGSALLKARNFGGGG